MINPASAGLKEAKKRPGEAVLLRIQICLATPSFENARQFVKPKIYQYRKNSLRHVNKKPPRGET
jgi:hypothetical protein